MRDLVKGKEHFEKKLKDLGIDISKIDGDLKEDIEKIEQRIEKRMKKDGVAKRRADLYEERAKDFYEEFDSKFGLVLQGKTGLC